MGHEDHFPLLRLTARSVIRKRTVAATQRNGRDAPKPVVPKIVFGPWVRAVPNVCLGDQRDARLFKIG
jgi:hypothetical protein